MGYGVWNSAQQARCRTWHRVAKVDLLVTVGMLVPSLRPRLRQVCSLHVLVASSTHMCHGSVWQHMGVKQCTKVGDPSLVLSMHSLYSWTWGRTDHKSRSVFLRPVGESE